MRLYGPYVCADGRKRVQTIDSTGKRRTMQYAKYLMEQLLGRELDPNLETIDHIDRDFTNDDVSNLRIVSRQQHAREDHEYAEMIEVVCIRCGNTTSKRPKNLRHNAKQGKAGPFCGKSCAGKYSTDLQYGRIVENQIQPSPPSTYYMLDKPA